MARVHVFERLPYPLPKRPLTLFCAWYQIADTHRLLPEHFLIFSGPDKLDPGGNMLFEFVDVFRP
jgi:hypothetical protein